MAGNHNYECDIDFADSTVSELSNVFEYEVEEALTQASRISLQNINLAEVYYMAVPAWYDRTGKKLYSAITTGHYWAVDGNKLTYT